jgi:hypothetical protein
MNLYYFKVISCEWAFGPIKFVDSKNRKVFWARTNLPTAIFHLNVRNGRNEVDRKGRR